MLSAVSTGLCERRLGVVYPCVQQGPINSVALIPHVPYIPNRAVILGSGGKGAARPAVATERKRHNSRSSRRRPSKVRVHIFGQSFIHDARPTHLLL